MLSAGALIFAAVNKKCFSNRAICDTIKFSPLVNCESRRQAWIMRESKSVFEAALPLQKHPKPSLARPRAVVKRNSLHSASALLAKAAYPFLPFSSQNQSIGFDFDKEEGGSRAQFSSSLTEMAQATLSCPCGAIHLAERRELLLTQARVTNCETSFAIALFQAVLCAGLSLF